MKNWVPRRYSFLQSLRYRVSESILRALDGRSEIMGWPLPKSVVTARDHCLWHRDRETTACPKGLSFDLSSVVLGDLFFLEEFPRLHQGIEKLNRDCGNRIFGQKPQEIDEWFEDAHTLQSRQAGTKPFGYFDLRKLKKPRLFRYCEVISLQLKQFSPSMMAMSIVVTPSSDFRGRFKELISTDAMPLVDLDFRPWLGFFPRSIRPAVYKKRLEVESLFLKLNEEIVRLLRRYVGAGLSRYGPLPSIEVINVDESLRFFPPQRRKLEESDLMKNGFWRGMGLDVYHAAVYTTDMSRTYRVERDRKYRCETYQLLQSSTDFRRVHKSSVSGEIQKMIASENRYLLPELCSLIAVRHFYSVLQKEILLLRDRIVPVFIEESGSGISLRNLKRTISKLAAINGLHFQLLRANSELSVKFTRHYLTEDLKGFKRSGPGMKESTEFTDDIFWAIERSDEFIRLQLEAVKSAFQELVSQKSIRLNNAIQILLIVLTLFIALLTAVLLLPERLRTTLIERLF